MEITPGVSRNTFRDNDPRADIADAEYRAKRPAVLRRVHYTCVVCGVKSVDAMEIHHMDCNHANNSDANFAPECVFCHPVNHIGELAARLARTDASELAGGASQLAFLPDIGQSDLSHLMRTLGHVLGSADTTEEQKDDARAIFASLMEYSHYIESAWGTSEAGHFAIALKEVAPEVYEARAEPMAGLRVLFALNVIVGQSKKFANEFVSIPMASWPSIFARRAVTD